MAKKHSKDEEDDIEETEEDEEETEEEDDNDDESSDDDDDEEDEEESNDDEDDSDSKSDDDSDDEDDESDEKEEEEEDDDDEESDEEDDEESDSDDEKSEEESESDDDDESDSSDDDEDGDDAEEDEEEDSDDEEDEGKTQTKKGVKKSAKEEESEEDEDEESEVERSAKKKSDSDFKSEEQAHKLLKTIPPRLAEMYNNEDDCFGKIHSPKGKEQDAECKRCPDRVELFCELFTSFRKGKGMDLAKAAEVAEVANDLRKKEGSEKKAAKLAGKEAEKFLKKAKNLENDPLVVPFLEKLKEKKYILRVKQGAKRLRVVVRNKAVKGKKGRVALQLARGKDENILIGASVTLTTKLIAKEKLPAKRVKTTMAIASAEEATKAAIAVIKHYKALLGEE